MTVVKKSRSVPYTCADMYQLVNDIEKYAEFLPYFSSGTIHYQDVDEVQATLVISAAGMSKSFTTRNRLQTNKMIEMRLVDGPFSHFEGFWRFDETSNGCTVSLDLEFDFAGRMFSMLLAPIFEQISNTLVDAFCERADKIYANKKCELVYVPRGADALVFSTQWVDHLSVGDLVQASGFAKNYPEVLDLAVGIFSQQVTRDTLVKAGDRVELYCPLIVDPKERRRRRA